MAKSLAREEEVQREGLRLKNGEEITEPRSQQAGGISIGGEVYCVQGCSGGWGKGEVELKLHIQSSQF